MEYNSLHDGQPCLSCLGLFFSAPVCLAWRQAFCLSEYLLKPLMRYLSAGWGHSWKECCVFIALDQKSESSWLPCLWNYSVTEWWCHSLTPLFIPLLLLFLIKHHRALRRKRSDKAMFHRAYIWTAACESPCMWKFLWPRARVCVCFCRGETEYAQLIHEIHHFPLLFFCIIRDVKWFAHWNIVKRITKGKSKTEEGNYIAKVDNVLEK